MVEEGYSYWISLEEHHKIGGLGSALLEWLSDNNENKIKLKRLGVGDHFIHKLGGQEYVRDGEGINARYIVEHVKTI